MVTAGDIIERKRHGRCPDCDRRVRVAPARGDGTWCWTCPDCDRTGIGFPSRAAAYEAVKGLRNPE